VDPIVVEVTRGEVVEARHVVHAAVVRDGRLELAAGDAGLVTFLRSSAKPIQALPVLRARPDLDDEKVALMCASHLAAPEQVAVVRRILADAPATEADLECGHDPTRVAHNCSGKHAGFLALCAARGWPFEGYRHAWHPCQEAVLDEHAAPAEHSTKPAAGASTLRLKIPRMCPSPVGPLREKRRQLAAPLHRNARERGGLTMPSIGLNIQLPHEQQSNLYQDISQNFHYFFARKVMFVKFATAYVVLPGGFGTLDEVMEALTLVQTGKTRKMPIILVHEPFWRGLIDWFRTTLVAEGMISPEDLNLVQLIDEPQAVVDAIFDYYEKRGFQPSQAEQEILLNL